MGSDVHVTRRELQVIGLLARGFTKVEIADQMHLSVDTVKTHQKRVQHRWGAHNAAHLVAIAKDEGLI